MDSVRCMLLTLASIAKESRARWQAERAAMRARGQTPTRNEAYTHHLIEVRCLIAAIHAANLPANFRIHQVTLDRDPLRAAEQLQQLAFAHDTSGPIEAQHEPARQAYKAVYAEPVNEQEQRCIEILAGLPPARRDRIVDQVEQQPRGRDPHDASSGGGTP